MASLAEMKASSPAYQALTDKEFADKIYQKFYADTIARDEFDRRTAPKPVSAAGELAAPFAGFNKGVDALINLPGAAMNLGIKGINAGASLLGYDNPIPEYQPMEVAARANAGYEPQTRIGKAGEAIGEVAGSAVVPEAGILARGMNLASKGPAAIAAASPVTQKAAQLGTAGTVRAAALPTAGAGVGIDFARENELGPLGEMAAGLVGGIAVPNIVNAGARTAAGVKSGLEYGNRQIQRARNPEAAAYQDIADEMVKIGMDPEAALKEVAPQPSSALAKRGLTSDDMADIVSRRLNGEHPEDIGRDYKITGSTVKKYVDDFQAAEPTERNLIDVSKEMLGKGQSQPLADRARTDMAITSDPVAGDRLVRRQEAQPGRTAGIIEQSSIEGRSLEQEMERLAGIARKEEAAAYSTARQNAQPLNLRGVIRAARARNPQEGGQISEQMNKAVDLFFKGGLTEGEKGTMRYTRALDIVDDLPTYLRRRQELDQMIASSMKDGRATPLTAELTKFRQKLNQAARANNPALEDADARFAENRTTEKIIQRGENLGKRLTKQTKQALREFSKLTPTQQEIQRVAFESKMAGEALNVRRGNAAADQFNTEAFDQIVGAMYPKSAGKAVWQRGQALLKHLKREAITTETTRDVLSGSRTAPLSNSIAETLEPARAAANLATGRFTKILEDLANRLSRQIGGRAATERARILTETDPAQLLPILRRLSQEAKTSAERQAYNQALREFWRAKNRPVTQGAVAIEAEAQANR